MVGERIAGSSSERFQVKWAPVRVKKTRQHKDLEFGSDLIQNRAPGGRKLQNFAAGSYRFAAAMRVFHAGVFYLLPPLLWGRVGVGGKLRIRRARLPLSLSNRGHR